LPVEEIYRGKKKEGEWKKKIGGARGIKSGGKRVKWSRSGKRGGQTVKRCFWGKGGDQREGKSVGGGDGFREKKTIGTLHKSQNEP